MTSLRVGEVDMPQDTHFFILEDTPEYQRKIISCLNDLGFGGKMTLVETVSDAIEKFKASGAQFILSDWNLPDGMGIEFLKSVREDKSNENTPFIMVTTLDDIGNILQAVNEGADGYIVKPFKEEDIKEKISFAFEKRAS